MQKWHYAVLLFIIPSLASFLSTSFFPQSSTHTTNDVQNLPAGTWWTVGKKIDKETIVESVDLDPSTLGDQQILEVSPGDSVQVAVTVQVWSSGGPGIIKQVFATYSWNEEWPPVATP